ncbi:N-acetylhexosaminidase [Pluteus cervinus]|uniref:N-acetylhexosaminidase n=1 Tax=Pluteus cervinus TaxID=181527 RepID=A0ACD3AXT1_9AGAR|nr:N-acetylhexosaminidase [Pluteus cervinus]
MLLPSTVLLSIFLAPAVNALWPLPQQLTTGSTPLRLSNGFDIKFKGINNPPQDLKDAVSRTEKFLSNDKLQALVADRGASSASQIQRAKQLTSLVLSLDSTGGHHKRAADATANTNSLGNKIKSISDEAVAPIGQRSEGYTLTIPADGSAAVLSANSTLGLFRGLTTFSQLWYDWNGNTYTLQAPINIADYPKYPYRGFMLDTARNYFPVDDIKRTLDAMSWVKINTLHWHVVDSQSFPLVIPGFESISQKGAYNSAAVYTPQNVKDIVSYAAARGIDVLPEIDTPGHTSIISKAFPQHIACPEAAPWSNYANEPPSGQLRLASPDTASFTAKLLSSAASLFPGNTFSTGGDEINQNCYADDDKTQKDLKSQGKTFEQALDTFTQTTHAALHKAGKVAVVWEEMALDHPVTLRNDTIVMVWISSENAAAVAAKGYRIVHAPSDYFYLDCGGGGWVGANTLGNSWCDPFKTWQRAYSFDPVANLTASQKDLVLGGQQLLWTEQSSPSNLDSIVWPRAAASAEVFWSGPGGDSAKALPRLHDLAYRYNQRGVRAIALQPQWCALRPGACDLTA